MTFECCAYVGWSKYTTDYIMVLGSSLNFLPSCFFAGHHRRHSGGTGAGGGNSEENSSFVSGGAGEKRTRFVYYFLYSRDLK